MGLAEGGLLISRRSGRKPTRQELAIPDRPKCVHVPGEQSQSSSCSLTRVSGATGDDGLQEVHGHVVASRLRGFCQPGVGHSRHLNNTLGVKVSAKVRCVDAESRSIDEQANRMDGMRRDAMRCDAMRCDAGAGSQVKSVLLTKREV